MDYSFFQNYYCKLSIDDHPLIPKNISNCVIREWIFDILPRIEISILDDGYLTENFPILDNSILDIEVGVNPEDEHIFHAQFEIINKVIDNIEGNKASLITLSGILQTNDLYFTKTRSFKNMNSSQVISQISNELKLKFNKNLNLNTSDMMTWLQINQSNFQFIKHIVERAYCSDDVIFCYADIFGNLNYTSLKSEINKSYSTKAIYSLENFNKYEFTNKEDKKTIWYNSFNTANYTKHFNMNYGYGLTGNYYDSSKLNEINVNKDYHPLTEISNKSYDKTVNVKTFPIFTNNVFADYFKAKLQNVYFKNIFNISTVLNINSLSSVKLFDTIILMVNSLQRVELDEVQSGEYIVSGITHSFGNSSLYKKHISIHRNGYNRSQSV